MGWTYTNRYGQPAKDFIQAHCLTWSNTPHRYTVLDSAIVALRTYYAAVERIDGTTGERTVWAAVILLDFVPHQGYDIGYKDMDESMGPCEAECPERILALLTPTDSEYANDWRKRCWAKITARKARPTIQPGLRLTLYGKHYEVLERYRNKRGQWTARQTEDQAVYRLTSAQFAKASEFEIPAAKGRAA